MGKRARKRWLIVLTVLAGIAAGAAYCFKEFDRGVANTHTIAVDGIEMPSRAGKQYLQLFDEEGRPQDVLLKGVNIGMADPGHFPGEAAITKAQYARWLKDIGAMNANVVRVYTLHPPAFYEALAAYNAKAEHPIYLLQGVWLNEDKLAAAQDFYDSELTDEFKHDIRQMIDVIHGKANIAAMPGHASGEYKADVAKYVIGWVLGIEWDPNAVQATNAKHRDFTPYAGKYFKVETEGVSPFESWLAGMMDETASYESSQYGWQRPMSFTNWVTTDLLSHPSEPLEEEDMVAVNPNLIQAQPDFHAGVFASYHVYPYYPDFLNYETKYTDYANAEGRLDSYAGYLHDLKQSHDMPVLVAEFGVPASRGMTHRNIYGWNQGAHSEQEQGEIISLLFDDIRAEGMAGGLVFAWQDEWFKRTWNTMQLDNPDRRPFWSNAQTGEQQFGLLGFDPGDEKTALHPDGDTGDWEKAKAKPLPLNGAGPVAALDNDDPRRVIQRWYASSDERYVYFRLDFGQDGGPLDWSKTGAMILLDTIPGQGQHRLPGGGGLKTEAGIDFVIDLKGPEKSRVVVDSYYDPFYYEYGKILQYVPEVENVNIKDNGVYNRIMLGLNRPMDVPNVRGETLRLPLDSYETGALTYGNGNPKSAEFNSLTDVSVDADGHVVEVRIPWQLLNVKDPSTREIMGDIWNGGLESSETVTGMRMAVVTYRPSANADEVGGADLSYATAAPTDGVIKSNDMYEYEWDTWEFPTFHERLKKSYGIVQDLFARSDVPATQP